MIDIIFISMIKQQFFKLKKKVVKFVMQKNWKCTDIKFYDVISKRSNTYEKFGKILDVHSINHVDHS
jgi:hypothetical protein